MFNAIAIALVETRKAGNIGSSARAMKTMGLKHLRLVNPQQFPDKQADYMAVHAKDLLEKAQQATSLQEAIADAHLVIGTSARVRTIPVPVVGAQEATQIAVRYAQAKKRVVFVFGREDTGLTNEELRACHLHMQIDADENYGVLNLAAAVQVVSYLLRQASKKHTIVNATATENEQALVFNARWDEPLCTAFEFEQCMAHLEKVLIQLEVYDKSKSPHSLLPRFARLFRRVHLDSTEVGLLRGLLTAVEKIVAQDKK